MARQPSDEYADFVEEMNDKKFKGILQSFQDSHERLSSEIQRKPT